MAGAILTVGLEMLCYMLSHEAHHRGQVCMLAHQLGFPLPNEVAYGIWNWESCGKSRTTHGFGLWAVDAQTGS
jgi:DinB family